MSNKNPFTDFFSSFSDKNLFADNPFDFDKAVERGRANAKAFTEASKAISEGVQSVYSLNSKVMQKNAEEFSALFKNISASSSAEETVKKNADYIKKSVESAIASTNEMIDIANKSSKEASEIIGKVITDSIDQVAEDSANNASNSSASTKKKAA